MPYAAHDAFIAPAKGYPQIWRFVVGLGLAVAVYALGIFALMGLIALFNGGLSGLQPWMQRIQVADTPTATLLILGTFIGMGGGAMLATKLLHKRPIASLFGPLATLQRQFLIAVGVAAIVFAASMLIPTDLMLQSNLELAIWASFMPLALVGVLIQTGAEEILFRGYIQQQLAARFSNPTIWMVLPSVLFALVHLDPTTYGPNAWLIVAATALFGILAADLTAKTGNIGAAWGLHFANNVLALLLISLDGPLSGLALYVIPISVTSADILRPLIYMDMGITFTAWAAIRYAVTR